MCLATAAIVTIAASQAIGGIEKGNAAHYQAQVARNNATIEQQNAAYTASAAANQAEQSGLQERSKLANLRAAEAANGLDVNSGSPAEVQESERLIGRLNTETVSNNAALQAYGYQSKAAAQEGQANLDKKEQTWDTVAGFTSAAGTLAGSPTIQADIGGSSLAGAPSSVPANYEWMQNNSITAPDEPTDGSFSL